MNEEKKENSRRSFIRQIGTIGAGLGVISASPVLAASSDILNSDSNVIDSKKGTSQKLLDKVLFLAKLKMSEYRLHWILINS
jgi:hypothetical protein